MSYKLLSYADRSGEVHAGVLLDETVYNAAMLVGNERYATVLGILGDWEAAQPAFTAALAAPGRGEKLANVRLLPPILYPGQIYAAGANYQDHIDEMIRRGAMVPGPNAKQAGGRPWHFVKCARSAVVGPGARVTLPDAAAKVDWEIELAVVIGKAARNVSVERAMTHVAGYTITNDLSARDISVRSEAPVGSPFRYDWIGGKNFDGSCPMGPWIVPASQIPDPMNLAMKLWVDDAIEQDSFTHYMIFNIAEQIAELSRWLTLNPGDVIMTGTPDGVGMGKGVFLKPGQKLRLWIEGIGELHHEIAGSSSGR